MSLLSVLVAALLALSVSAQPYTPLVTPSNTAASCSGSSLVSFGNDNAAAFTRMAIQTNNEGEMYFSAYNATAIGATITQLSLALADNSALSSPTLLRLGLYSLPSAGSTTSASLVGQTAEITLFPSGAGLLYANLLAPTVLTGGLYAIGVFASSNFYVMGNGKNSSYYAYPNTYSYVEYSIPTTLSYVYSSTLYQFGAAAYGCQGSGGSTVPAGSQAFSMCAYVESYQPSPSTSDYTQVSSTTVTTISGILITSSTSTSSSFGTGYSITGGSGSVSISRSGIYSYYEPGFATSIASFVPTTTNKINGVAPSNLLYTSGTAAAADTNGISFLTSAGVQYTLQWNAATSQYRLLNSSAGGSSPAATVYSNVVLTPTTSLLAIPKCAPAPMVYTAPSVPSCPSGTLPIAFGDITADLVYSYYVTNGYSYVDGNSLYFRPFYNQVANTQILSLSTWLLANPNTVLHMRLGLYQLSGSISSPTWTLLSQAPEQVIINPVNASYVVPLPSAVTLPVGIFAIGQWFDQSTYTYETWWDVAPNPGVLYQAYTSLSSTGTLPTTASPSLGYDLSASGANGCIPNVASAPIQFSFCAAFKTQYSTETISGVLTALPTKSTGTLGSYWTLLSGYATDSYNPSYPLTLGPISNPTPMRLYDNTTSQGGAALDATGLQFYAELYGDEPYIYSIASKQIPNTPVFNYIETVQYYFQAATVNSVAGTFSYQPYTAGSPIPACTYKAATYANLIIPASPGQETCLASGQLARTLGDSIIADYANQKEGNGISGLTLATNSFTLVSTVSITQLAVDILANTALNFTVQLGLYSSTGALLGSTAVITLAQAYDQQVIGALATPVSAPAGTYYVGVVASAPLFIATSTTSSPSMTLSTFGVPSTLSTSATGPAVPVVAYGCSVASHSFCAQIQYNVPASAGGPTSTTYQYVGMLATTANADGSYTVVAGDVHGTSFQRVATVPTTTITGFSEMFPTTTSKVYPSAAQPVDATGLTFTSASLGTVTLAYSASQGKYVDSWGSTTVGLQPILSVFNLSAIGTSGVIVPSCNIFNLPGSISPASPAAPTCASPYTAVTLGDDVAADYSSNLEDYNYQNNAYASLRPIPNTGNQTVAVSQIALGLNNNVNSVANIAFAVYDQSYNLLAQSAVITVTNAPDSIIVGQLNTTVYVPPGSAYFAAVWSDNSLYLSFTFNTIAYCAQMPTGVMFPAVFPSGSSCGVVDLAAIGCTAPTTSTTSTTPYATNTGSSSSNNVDLSKGAVAGIVIGCVVGTNLLLLICLFLACGLGNKGGVEKSRSREQTYEPNSRVELQTAEPSRDTA